MWQTKLSFAVGFLLSAGSSIAVADSTMQTGKTPSSSGLSVAEVSTRGAAERRVRSFSLVELVKNAPAGGTAGAVPRISLVELMAEPDEPQAEPAASISIAGDQSVAVDEVKVASLKALPADTESVVETQVAPLKLLSAGTTADTKQPPALDVLPDSELPTAELRPPQVASLKALPADTESVDETQVAPLKLHPADRASYTNQPSVSDVLRDSALPMLEQRLPPAEVAASTRYAEGDVQTGKLALFDAVHGALLRHPAIVESLGRLEQQQEQVNIARAGYLPQLRSGINTGYRHTTGRSEEALTLSASQMIYDFGKVSSAVDAAASGVDREEAGVLLTAEDLIRETARAFIEARRYEVLLELATEQIEAIGELEALATKRSAMGASSVSDQMQAKSRREAARATQLQMQAQRDQWYRALEKLIGSEKQLVLDDIYPAPLEGQCPRLPENFDNAPRVVVAEAERAEAEAAIRQARAEQRPTVSVNADFEHYLNSRTGAGQQQLDDQEFVVSLNLSTNLFQGGALRARSRAAESALYSANAARDMALLELSRLFRETRARARSLTTSLALQDERHDSIVKTQELYRHQYLSLGTRTLLDILNTEQEIFQTLVDKQNTLFDLRSLQIDCLYSVGGLRDAFHAGDALNNRVLSHRAEVRL